MEVLLFDPEADPESSDALFRVPDSDVTGDTFRYEWEFTWSLDGQALFFRKGFDSNFLRMMRWSKGATASEEFVDSNLASTSSFPIEDLDAQPLNTIFQRCRGAKQFDATSSGRLVVAAECVRSKVVENQDGEKSLDLIDRGDNLLVMEVIPNADNPSLLDGRYTHRLSLNENAPAASVVRCDTDETCYTQEGFSSEFNPKWDPEGRRVAFLFRPEGSVVLEVAKQIHIADVEGSGSIEPIVQLAPDDPRWIFDPVWSPAGDWLAFVMIDDAEPSRDLYVVRSDVPGVQEPIRVSRGADVSGSIYWRQSGLVLPPN
jgi:hypothetical protein